MQKASKDTKVGLHFEIFQPRVSYQSNKYNSNISNFLYTMQKASKDNKVGLLFEIFQLRVSDQSTKYKFKYLKFPSKPRADIAHGP